MGNGCGSKVWLSERWLTNGTRENPSMLIPSTVSRDRQLLPFGTLRPNYTCLRTEAPQTATATDLPPPAAGGAGTGA